MNQKISYEIVHIVASTEVHQKLNLNAIKKNYPNTTYNPDKYFALIYKLTDPKISILVNWSGKIIFTRAKSIKDIEIGRDLFFNDLISIGYSPILSDIKINNIVSLLDIRHEMNLEKIYESHKNLDLEIELEIFPGMIFKNNNPKFTALIFKSGKIVITGLKDLNQILESITEIEKKLEIKISI